MLIKTRIMQRITDHKAKIKNRDAKLFDEYHQLMGIEGAMKTAVMRDLMGKYKLYSLRTIYRIIANEQSRRNTNTL